MRRILCLLSLFCFLAGAERVWAQGNIIPNKIRTAPEAAPVAVPKVGAVGVVGVVVPSDSKLIPGDEVSVKVEEDNESPIKTFVTDTGHVDLGVLGFTKVSGMTAAQAASAVANYLVSKYYYKATVEFMIIRKVEGALQPFKVRVDGRVNRGGKRAFTDAEPLTLSEAVSDAIPTQFADLRRVRLTRNGATQEYDVDAIIKKGRTQDDVRLQDSDRIYVPPTGIRFTSE